jgi:hemoglobin
MKRNMVLLASDIARGRERYPGRNMLEVHRPMGITNDEFDAALSHLHRALLRNGVKPADVALVMAAAASTRKSIVQAGTRPAKAPAAAATLWGRLGGEKGVTQMIDDLMDEAVKDPKVNFSRNGKFPMTPERVAAVKRHMVRLASALGEGPYDYDGRRMGPVHKDMGITDDEFDAFISKLKIALARNRVGEQDQEVILKAVSATRKDIVEVKSGKAADARGNNNEPSPLVGILQHILARWK